MESEQRDISNETDATPLHGMENEVSEIDSSIGPNKRGRDKRSRQDKRDSGIDMLNGPLPGKILRFAIPLALSSILQQLLNSADASIAGQFVSSFSLAGIGGVNPVTAMFVNLFVGLSIGANVVVAMHVGAGEFHSIKKSVHTAMTLSLIAGVALGAAGLALAPWVLDAIGMPEDSLADALTYVRLYFCAIPFLTIYNFGSALLRAHGDAKRPLYALAAAVVMNFVLDLAFVRLFSWGTAGIGIATIIAAALSAVIVVAFLMREEGPFRLHLRELSISGPELAGILRIGIPAGVQGAVFSLSNTLGADIMVLPAGASGNASEVLFCAEPVNVYLPASAAEAVAATEGVAASTPQFFTQTVDQSCCSVVGVTRVVGIDATTDFVLAPWIVGGVEGAGDAGASAEVDAFGLGDDGILLGSAAPAIEGGQASILGSVFHVAGTLAPTGTSVDETIFMDIDAARTIAAASPYLESVWGDADPFDAVSCLMVKAADGSDIDALCQALVDAVPGSVAVRTADMVSGASSQLAVVEAIAVAFLIVLVILAALALAGRFSALAASRMRELGLLRTFGMSRGRVVGCFACEIGLVTLVAAVVAVVVACLVVGTFHSEFNMPGAAVPASAYGAAVAVGLLFAVALTAVALVQPVVQMLRRDPQETLTRGDM